MNDPRNDEPVLDSLRVTRGDVASIRFSTRPDTITESRLAAIRDFPVHTIELGVQSMDDRVLARANRGFLYIDEVNLLEDHLVDALLDVAASGENVVEREGLSIRHPASFVLVGSGNPEEGELRPQLLDRFGLSVEVTTPQDLKTRVAIVRQRDAFERDREGFIRAWKRKDGQVRRRLVKARELLPEVEVPAEVIELASNL